MKSRDVGSIPVLADDGTTRLVGIITDRDLALNVLADRRDPRTTRIEEIMTSDPVSCRSDDDLLEAMRAMSRHQVRRIPVVSDEGDLLGIISLADVARQAQDGYVGAVVGNISEPEGFTHRPTRIMGRATGLATPVAGALGLAAGAGLMYLLDPARGRTRRYRLQERAVKTTRKMGHLLKATAKDLRNRRMGILAKTRSLFREETAVPDAKLEARVRSALGRATSHPHAVDIAAQNGCIRFSGPILADEADRLEALIRKVPGVKDVENRVGAPAGRASAGAASGS
jgi:predicted transcriptional regulator